MTAIYRAYTVYRIVHVIWARTANLFSGEYHWASQMRSLISGNAVIWADVRLDLCRYMASLGPNKFRGVKTHLWGSQPHTHPPIPTTPPHPPTPTPTPTPTPPPPPPPYPRHSQVYCLGLPATRSGAPVQDERVFHTFISLSKEVLSPVQSHQVQKWPKNWLCETGLMLIGSYQKMASFRDCLSSYLDSVNLSL